jgi:lysophospholipase L1-like esterase
MTAPRSSRLLRALVATGGLVVALVLAELIVRGFALAPTAGVATVDAATFARVPGVYAPARHYDGLGLRGLGFAAAINSLGYRGHEPQDAAASLRVLFVGDSFVFGDFVADDQTWPAQLQAALDCARPVVVYNAGVAGGTVIEASAMAERGARLAPDVIVTAFTAANDVHDLLGPSLWSRMAAKRAEGWWRDASSRLLARSALWNLVRRVRMGRDSRARLSAASPAVAQAQERYAGLLRGWAARARGNGTPLVFAAYPSHPMLAQGERGLHDWALAVARAAGLDPVDLWPVLARNGHSPDDVFLVPRDQHPSPAGYALAARAVAQALRDRVPAFRDCRVR